MIATVIKEVILLALGTVALVAAHGFGAALKNGLQRFALFEAQGVTVARKERFMEPLNNLRYGVIALPCRFSAGAGVHVLSRTLCQFINDFERALFAEWHQMRIQCGRLDSAVPQVNLQLADAHPHCMQMSRV